MIGGGVKLANLLEAQRFDGAQRALVECRHGDPERERLELGASEGKPGRDHFPT